MSFSMEQEQSWALELRESRLRLIARVREASSMSSPTRRMALYQQWRTQIGDNAARESAKFSEACLLYTSPSPRDVEESRMPSSA